MKRLLAILLILALYSCDKEKRYCGKVIDKGYDPQSSGYKTSSDPEYFIILLVDSINLSIRVNVTIPTYYSINKNDHECFMLNESELSSYGNGSIHLIK